MREGAQAFRRGPKGPPRLYMKAALGHEGRAAAFEIRPRAV
jgi:hypothetical protein